MKLIFLDTETTGLPADSSLSYTNIDNCPRIVQLSWIIYKVYDDKRKYIEERDYIIKPYEFSIPTESALIHGITTEKAISEGHNIDEVLKELVDELEAKPIVVHKGDIVYGDYECVSAIIGHNLSFDINVIKSELFRLGLDDKFPNVPLLDTMIYGKDYCKFQNNYGEYRFPKLSELYSKIFAKTFPGAHNSYNDIRATYSCFWKLVELGIIDLDSICKKKENKYEMKDPLLEKWEGLRKYIKNLMNE